MQEHHRSMRATEWQASPRHVRVFHGSTSTVLDWQNIAAARRIILDHPEVQISGITLDESDLNAMWAEMVTARQEQLEDFKADQSMGLA